MVQSNDKIRDDGHCGVIERGEVENDTTLANLAKQSVSPAQAGCDILAPSGMMDGMVRAIRGALDDSRFTEVPVMSTRSNTPRRIMARSARPRRVPPSSATAAPTK